MTRAEVAEKFLAAALGKCNYEFTAMWLNAVAQYWWKDSKPGELPWQETSLGKMAKVLEDAAEADKCADCDGRGWKLETDTGKEPQMAECETCTGTGLKEEAAE